MVEMLTEPVEGPTVWRADELTEDDWLHRWSPADLDVLRQGADQVRGRDVHALEPDESPLAALEPLFDEVIEALDHGRGFVLLRGLPLDAGFDGEAARAVFWAVCSRIGRLVPTERDGTLLNQVYDRGPLRDPDDRVYTTNRGGYLHTDGAEIVGLMCLRPSATGGESIIASSMTLYNIVLAEHPEWLPILYKPFACDWKNEAPPGSRGWYPHTLYCYVDGWLSGALRTGYHRGAQRFPDVAPLTDDELACFEYLESIPQRPGITLEMPLEPGDIQLVNNLVTLHSRNPYDDDPAHPERRRHMLRYWISRSGVGPRRVSPDYEFIREDYFGLNGPAPDIEEA